MAGQRRLIIGVTIAAGTALLTYFLPLFHVVPLGGTAQNEAFEPAAFVDRFWTAQLLPASDGAVDASELVTTLRNDHQAARAAFGRTVGLSEVYYYFIAGTGRVVSVEKNSIGLAVRDGENEIEVTLETGPVFGNAIRDGTGLLDINDFPNSQDFNALSSEINRRVEEQVLPTLRRVAIGDSVHFVGCAEIMDEATDLQPLRVVPFIAEVQ